MGEHGTLSAVVFCGSLAVMSPIHCHQFCSFYWILHRLAENRLELQYWATEGEQQWGNINIFFDCVIPNFQFLSMCLFICLSVFPCNFFRGLSLALRSHDQTPASHWLKKFRLITRLLQNCIVPTIRINWEILCLPYAGFTFNEIKLKILWFVIIAKR